MVEPYDTIDTMTLEELRGIPEEYIPPAPPTLTSQTVQDVVADLIKIEDNNGYLGIAKKRDIHLSQVKLIDRVRRDRIYDLTAIELPEEEPLGQGKKTKEK